MDIVRPDSQPENPPKVSVCIRAYNAGRYIAEAVDSVLCQTFTDFELLVVDDGSTDDTVAVVEAFDDPRLRLIRRPHAGLNATTNYSLTTARGEYVAIMDADDVAKSDRLERQAAALDADPSLVVVGTWLEMVDARGVTVGVRRYPLHDAEIRRTVVRYNPFAHPTIMFRRSVALRAGGYRTDFQTVEDFDFTLRLLQAGRGMNLPATLVRYRMHDASTKSRKTKLQLRETIAIRKVAIERYGYPRDLAGLAVNTVQHLLLFLPAKVIVELFSRTFIVRRRAT